MSEINVLRGRKFEDCYQEYLGNDTTLDELRDLLLERLGLLKLPINPDRVIALSNIIDAEALDEINLHARFCEACDLITRTLFNQSLFESTQADIEAEAALRDAENEYSRATEAAQAAFAKYNELYAEYQTKVEELKQ